jgi:hypothetical protein
LGVSPRRSAEGQGALTKAQGRRTRDGPPPSLFHARNLDWLKMKNPEASAVKREAEEDWGSDKKAPPVRTGLRYLPEENLPTKVPDKNLQIAAQGKL